MHDAKRANTETGLGLQIPDEVDQAAKGGQNTSVPKSDRHSTDSSHTLPLLHPSSPLPGGAERVLDGPTHVTGGVRALFPDLTAPGSTSPRLGSLHKRRASASPEKFNTGKFEPLPLRTDVAQELESGRPAKRPRIENKLEVKYDAAGTPHIASITPTTILPSGLRIPTPRIINRPKPQVDKKKVVFSVLNALCRHNDLILHVVSFMTIPSLISLYVISKPFHWLFNRHHTAFILAIVRTWAPDSEIVFPWRCYKSLCIKDPVLRQKSQWAGREHELRMKETHDDLRDVPSLHWLQMVIWRHGVAKDTLLQLAMQGLRCPKGTLDVVKRMWFIMDLPLNAHRIALCRSEKYITDQTIKRATILFLKVDMSFTDPAGQVFAPADTNTNTSAYPRNLERHGFIGCGLRETLMAERQLTSLWRVIRGWSPDPTKGTTSMSRLDVLKLWVRHKYKPRDSLPDDVKKLPIMGIPWWEVGTAGLERTGVTFYNLDGKQTAATNPGLAGRSYEKHQNQQILYPHRKRIIVPNDKPRELLLRPDELMIREAIRRKMKMHEQWVKMMLWGFCDLSGRALPLRTEDQLIKWSNGIKPKHPFFTDEEFERRKAEAAARAANSAKTEGSTTQKATAGEQPAAALGKTD